MTFRCPNPRAPKAHFLDRASKLSNLHNLAHMKRPIRENGNGTEQVRHGILRRKSDRNPADSGPEQERLDLALAQDILADHKHRYNSYCHPQGLTHDRHKHIIELRVIFTYYAIQVVFDHIHKPIECIGHCNRSDYLCNFRPSIA